MWAVAIIQICEVWLAWGYLEYMYGHSNGGASGSW